MAASDTMPLTTTSPRLGGRDESPPAQAHGKVLLRAEGLRKSFGGQVVLDGLDLELREGEVVLLRGENGSGKTTLLNILTGNLEPDAGSIHYLADSTPRSYRFPRPWWRDLNPFDHFTPEFVSREGVGRTWQEIRLFGAQTLRDNIAVAEPGHPGENPVLALFFPGRCARREAQINRQADAMLARLGLAGREGSSADKISLGQSKRVAIARAVAAGARILFLDEPLAGLDRQGISDVLDLLGALVGEQRVTLVIVEHVFNQPHLHGLVTTDWLLEDGAMRRGDGNDRGGLGGHPHVSGAAGSASRRPAWFRLLAGTDAEVVDEPLPGGALLTRIRRPGVFHNPPKAVLEIGDLIVKRGPRVVIGLDRGNNHAGLRFNVYAGEIVVLQAPNGWGKTTLISAIAGLLATHSGDIRLNGMSLKGLPTWERVCAGLSVLPSDGHVFPTLRARESVQLAGCMSTSADLGSLANRTCSSLSGGEQRRLAVIAMRQGLVALCDEPFGALDSDWARSAATELLAKHQTLFIAEPYRQEDRDA